MKNRRRFLPLIRYGGMRAGLANKSDVEKVTFRRWRTTTSSSAGNTFIDSTVVSVKALGSQIHPFVSYSILTKNPRTYNRLALKPVKIKSYNPMLNNSIYLIGFENNATDIDKYILRLNIIALETMLLRFMLYLS